MKYLIESMLYEFGDKKPDIVNYALENYIEQNMIFVQKDLDGKITCSENF